MQLEQQGEFMQNYETMAANLKVLRTESGLTQAGIAEILGVNKTTVMRWETGDTLPDVRTIMWYADRFDVSLDWLFGRKRTISGSFRDLLAKEVGEAIAESIKPGRPAYDELIKEIDSAMEAYGIKKGE